MGDTARKSHFVGEAHGGMSGVSAGCKKTETGHTPISHSLKMPSVLECAVAHNWTAVRRHLVAGTGGDPLAQAGDQTVLSLAVRQGRPDVVRLLLDLAPPPAYLTTALTEAIVGRHMIMLNALLCAGAVPDDAHISAAFGTGFAVIIGQIVHRRYERVVAMLGASPRILIDVVCANRIDTVIYVLDFDEAKAVLNARELVGGVAVTPLVAAVCYAGPDVAQLLLDAGADINVPDGAGAPPLLHAVNLNKFAMVDLLLYRGAAVDGLLLRCTTDRVDVCDALMTHIGVDEVRRQLSMISCAAMRAAAIEFLARNM